MYGVWKESSGEYVTEDDKPIVDPRGNVHTQNETKFKYWAMEQYGMTAEEYRGYTFKGTGKTILETAGAYFKVTAPIDAKKGITYLAKKGVTPKNILKAAFGMTDNVVKKESTEKVLKETTIEMLRKKKEPLIPEPMPKKQLQRIVKGFKRQGGVIQMDVATDKYLESKMAEAITLNESTILLRQRPNRASVFEELIHATQFRKGLNDGSRISRLENEIAAQRMLLKNSRAYKLTEIEIKQTESALASYIKELKNILGEKI